MSLLQDKTLPSAGAQRTPGEPLGELKQERFVNKYEMHT